MAHVPGGGNSGFMARLDSIGVTCVGAATENDACGIAIGRATELDAKWAGVSGTHGQTGHEIFSSFTASEWANANVLVVVGANKDGESNETHFQFFREKKFKSTFPKNNIFKITNEKGFGEGDLIDLCNLMDNARKKGKPFLLSIPNNFDAKLIPFTEKLKARFEAQPSTDIPALSSEAEKQLDTVKGIINDSPDLNVLFSAGGNWKNAVRQSEGNPEVKGLFYRMVERIGGNVLFNGQHNDLYEQRSNDGYNINLPVAYHNVNPDLYKALNNHNLHIFCGGYPGGEFAGIIADAKRYKEKTTVIIDDNPKRLERIRKALTYEDAEGKEVCNAILIEADPRAAAQYLESQVYKNSTERRTRAEKIVFDCNSAFYQNENQIPGTKDLRDFYDKLTYLFRRSDRGKKVFNLVDSGDFANKSQYFLDNPQNTYYPPEGTLGWVVGKAHQLALKGEVDKIRVFIGDGGFGYNAGHMSHLAKIAHKTGITIEVIVGNSHNQNAIQKGFEKLVKDPDQKIGYLKTGELPIIDASKIVEEFPWYNPKGVSLDGTKPDEVIKAMEEHSNHPGLVVYNIDIHKIANQYEKTETNKMVLAAAQEGRAAEYKKFYTHLEEQKAENAGGQPNNTLKRQSDGYPMSAKIGIASFYSHS